MVSYWSLHPFRLPITQKNTQFYFSDSHWRPASTRGSTGVRRLCPCRWATRRSRGWCWGYSGPVECMGCPTGTSSTALGGVLVAGAGRIRVLSLARICPSGLGATERLSRGSVANTVPSLLLPIYLLLSINININNDTNEQKKYPIKYVAYTIKSIGIHWPHTPSSKTAKAHDTAPSKRVVAFARGIGILLPVLIILFSNVLLNFSMSDGFRTDRTLLSMWIWSCRLWIRWISIRLACRLLLFSRISARLLPLWLSIGRGRTLRLSGTLCRIFSLARREWPLWQTFPWSVYQCVSIEIRLSSLYGL